MSDNPVAPGFSVNAWELAQAILLRRSIKHIQNTLITLFKSLLPVTGFTFKYATTAVGPTTIPINYNFNLKDGDYLATISIMGRDGGVAKLSKTAFSFNSTGGVITLDSDQWEILVTLDADVTVGQAGNIFTALVTAPSSNKITWKITVLIEGTEE